MKKKLSVVLMLITVLAIALMTACSSSGSGEVKYSDEDFIKSVGKGLEARWKLQDNQKDSSTVASMREAIQTELDAVSEYKTATFEDSVLQEKALKYINILNDSLANVDYYGSTTDYDKWTEVYDQRTIILKDFVDNYGLKVSSTYQTNLDEIAANGKTAGDNADRKEAIEKIVKDLKFEVVEDDGYGWKTYEAVLENTTDYTIKHLSVNVNLLDSDGVIADTAYTDVDNVSSGQKAKLTFSTDKEFEKYETIVNYFEAE